MVVGFGVLDGDAEEAAVEAFEVGGVADEDAVLGGQVFLEGGGASHAEVAEEDVGVGGPYLDAAQGGEAVGHALAFLHEGGQVELVFVGVAQEVVAGGDGYLVDGPGHALGLEALDEGGAGGDVAQTEAGDGELLGHGVEHDDVGKVACLGGGDEGQEGVGGVAGIEDVEDVGVSLDAAEQFLAGQDGTGGVAGIADPEEVEVGGEGGDAVQETDFVLVQAAGVGVFLEGGGEDAGMAAAEGLGGEVDGLGGAVGDEYFVGGESE